MTDMERTVQPLKGHFASFTAYVIFGLNIIASKGLANSGAISPLGLFCFRAIGASALFWIAGLFIPKEKIDKGDYLKIFAASMIGLYLTQIAFLKAITQTTPTDAAILSAFAPIMTMFFAAIFLKEPITFKKMFGVAMSFSGAILLVFNSVNTRGVQIIRLRLAVFCCLSTVWHLPSIWVSSSRSYRNTMSLHS